MRVSGHLRIVDRKTGPVWYMRYRLCDGRQVQKRLGAAFTGRGRPPAGQLNRRAAQEMLEDALAAARKESPVSYPTNREFVTFAAGAAEYLRFVEDVRQIDAATIADYRGVIEGYLLAEFGERSIRAITPDDIDAYKERLLDAGKISNRTIVRHLTVLHGIFKRAKRVWGLETNPASADLVERPKVIYTGEFDTYDRGEIDRLAAAAPTEQEAALYQVAAFTGLRQGELLALRWSCVDFVAGLLHVRRNYTDGREKVPKGKRVRSVPMMPQVVDVLARLKDREHFTGEDDLVFCSDVGEYVNSFTIRRRFYAAIDAAGLRRIRFHDLRHAFGTAAIAKLDAFAVQSYMGHQHYSTTQRYLHHRPRPEHAAAIAEAFEPAASPAESVPPIVPPKDTDSDELRISVERDTTRKPLHVTERN